MTTQMIHISTEFPSRSEKSGDTEPGSAEQQLDDWFERTIVKMDDLCGMARNPETVDLIERNAIAIGQIAFRANLILSFLESRQPQPKLVWRR